MDNSFTRRLAQIRDDVLSDPGNAVARAEARHFKPFIGHPFALEVEGWGKVGVVLIAVTERPRPGLPANARLPFSLTLRAPHQPRLPQGTYGLLHDSFGRMSLFMVPVGADEAGVKYQVIFN